MDIMLVYLRVFNAMLILKHRCETSGNSMRNSDK